MPTAEILLKIQNEMKCGKGRFNSFGGFAYRNAEASYAEKDIKERKEKCHGNVKEM